LGGFGQATSSTINIGSLVVDMYSTASKQLAWTGTATKTVNPGGNQQKDINNLALSLGERVARVASRVRGQGSSV